MKKLFMIVPIFLFAFALSASASHHGGGDNGCGNGSCDDPPEEECNECLSLDIDNRNDATFSGEVNSSANTGWNKANWNGGLGKIDTGNLTAQVVIESHAGDNSVKVNAPWLGGMSIKNMNTAAFSGSVNSSANTGWNDASGNDGMFVRGTMCRPTITMKKEGAGKITTGNVNVTAGIAQYAGGSMVTLTSSN